MNSRPMETRLAFLACAVVLSGRLCMAQTGESPDDWRPSSLNQPGKEYPQVNSEGRVRTRISAPQAQKVELDIGGRRYALTKGENGVWTGGESQPQDEGFHYYQIWIDGAAVPDPGTLYFYGASRWGSGVEVPAHDQDFYALKDVPHGHIRQILYFSKSTDTGRRCFVYTPPDYDQDQGRRYPVLYLQHGSGEDETGWGVQGKANLILDNLIAEKKAVPMIIVMENGNANRPAAGTPAIDPPGRGRTPRGGISAFEEVLIKEVIPMIDGSFRTIADRGHRAMAGLSMGANQTLQITMNHLDLFSHIGAFSGTSNYPSTAALDPATFANGRFKDGEVLNRQIKLLWLGLGTKEPNPFPGSVGAFKAMLDQVGIKYTYYESPGTAHEWLTWRRDLHEFAPLLFNASSSGDVKGE